MRNGIDISKYQIGLDLKRAKSEKNPQFVIMRLGVGGSGKDVKFDDFYRDAKNAAIPKGAYFYGNATTIAEARAEANAAIEYLKGRQLELPVFYDVESTPMMNLDKNELTSIIRAFCDAISEAGYKSGVYTSYAVFENVIDDNLIKDVDHWVAAWSFISCPKLSSGAVTKIWQTGSDTHYQDDMEVDTDVCYEEGYFSKPKDNGKERICAEIKNIITALDNIKRIIERQGE